MWEFCSRYTLAVTIACIYILGSIVYFMLALYNYFVYYNNIVCDVEYRKQLKSDAVRSMIKCLVTALISGLFIVALIKRDQYFIIPWLVLGVCGFYVSGKLMYWGFIGAMMGDVAGYMYVVWLLITTLLMGTQIAVFYFSISLYIQLNSENFD